MADAASFSRGGGSRARLQVLTTLSGPLAMTAREEELDGGHIGPSELGGIVCRVEGRTAVIGLVDRGRGGSVRQGVVEDMGGRSGTLLVDLALTGVRADIGLDAGGDTGGEVERRDEANEVV
jgi:hypothetical protein